MDLRRISAPCSLVLLLTLLAAAPALALDFRVHGYELGERIGLLDGRSVWTAELDVSVEGIADHVDAFCVDIETTISSPATYHARALIDAYSGVSPADETPRDFAWAGYVVDHYQVDALATGGITRSQAITGVQAAIWDGLYQAAVVDVGSLSAGARSVYEQIMSGALAAVRVQTGRTLVVDLVGKQDQIFTAPVPEPGAALLFGVGLVIAGRHARRGRR